HDRHALDVLRFDVVDAADVEEVVLVVVRQQPFHLSGVHAAVGLGDVDDRQVQLGKDVDFHAGESQAASTDDGDDGHHDRDRVPQSENDRVHANHYWQTREPSQE